MKVGIIGAGPAGISCGYQLAKQGIAVDVFESDASVGGMAKSIELWGQKVDLGPHRFFSKDHRINSFWLEVVGNDYVMVDRLTRIYYQKKFFYYPLRPANALINLGFVEAARCLESYVKEKLFPTAQDNTFEKWVVHRFGQRLFEIFFKAYTEKLWGISCSELDSDFAAQRIKKLSLYEAVKNAAFTRRQSSHQTLIDQFAYCVDGTGAVYQKMADFVHHGSGEVFTDTPIKKVVVDDMKTAVGIESFTGQTAFYDHVVSTMPITQLVRCLPSAPSEVVEACNSLRYRNTILVYLRVDSDTLFKDNWLYIHSPDLLMGRVTNFRNWAPEICNGLADTILTLEYWCFDEEKLWQMTDEELLTLGMSEIETTGLLHQSKVIDGYVLKISKSYPVYHKGYKRALNKIENYLDTFSNLSVIGRGGAFKYNNQDHSMLMGMLAAENIAEETNHNLWDINTGDDYQEHSFITESGLQRK